MIGSTRLRPLWLLFVFSLSEFVTTLRLGDQNKSVALVAVGRTSVRSSHPLQLLRQGRASVSKTNEAEAAAAQAVEEAAADEGDAASAVAEESDASSQEAERGAVAAADDTDEQGGKVSDVDDQSEDASAGTSDADSASEEVISEDQAQAEGMEISGEDDLLEIEKDDAGKLQMVLLNLPPQPDAVKVDKVDKGGWAESVGIQPGAEIVTINGKIAKDMSMKDFMNAMKGRPLKLTVKPPKDEAGAPSPMTVPSGQVAPFGKAVPGPAPAPPPQQKKQNETKVQQPTPTVLPVPSNLLPVAPAPAPAPMAKQSKRQVRSAKRQARRAKRQAKREARRAKRQAKRQSKGKAGSKSPEELAREAGRKAGAMAGKNTAKKLLDEFKKHIGVLKNKTDAAVAVAKAAASAAVAKNLAPAPAPAPVAHVWQPIKPVDIPVVKDIPRTPNAGPPEPVPPSPLDALKAAMAIRQGLAPNGHAPLLPPDVLDRVADMAHSKLGNFVPGAPSPGATPCNAHAPAPAPAAAPIMAGPNEMIVEKVEVTMTVKNMSFTALSNSPSMMAQFEQSVKQSLAESAGPGVGPEDIEVDLSSGSVVVDSKITPPPGRTAQDMDKTIEKGSGNAGSLLVARVSALPGIDTIALGKISTTGITVKVIKQAVPAPTTTTTTPPSRHLPKPPKCAGAPPKMSHADVRMALAPFKPPGAKSQRGVRTHDGGTAWPLEDGGWAFQYPDMALRMEQDGSTRIVWSKPAYSVEYDESGISYHVGQNVVHRGANGDLTYQQPTGTMHQEGDTLVYHWCNPNVIVYQTPAGFVYYDDMGMTYRSFGKDVTHYTWSGEVLYQGAGGVTSQSTDGTVTHWTDAGAVYRHKDGSVFYTPVGDSKVLPLSVSELGPDPFAGKELTTEDVMRMSEPSAGPAPAEAK